MWWVAEIDDVNGTLEYATYVGNGGNCGFNSSSTRFEWQCDDIEALGSGASNTKGIAIAVDPEGYPLIAYGTSGALKVARPAATFSPVLVGNCGPQNLFFTWQCDTISIGFLSREADYASLAVNSSGLATIAYNGNILSQSGDLQSLTSDWRSSCPMFRSNRQDSSYT